MFMIRTSTSPSLSKSPNAQPRLECVAATPPRFVDQLLESAVAKIAEHQARRAKRIRREGALHFRIDTAGHDEQVGQAVVVEIDHARAPADIARLDANAGADRHVVEVALAVVAIEHIRIVGKMGLEDVEIAVEVVVADADAHAGLLQAVFAERGAALEAFLRNVPSCWLRNRQLGVESQAT